MREMASKHAPRIKKMTVFRCDCISIRGSVRKSVRRSVTPFHRWPKIAVPNSRIVWSGIRTCFLFIFCLFCFVQVMSLIRKQVLNAVYSDIITSSVEKRKESSGGGKKRGKDKEEKKEFLERIPYFTLVQRMRETQVDNSMSKSLTDCTPVGKTNEQLST